VKRANPPFERRDVAHVGFVVEDVPTAAERWTMSYGAGPFFAVGGEFAARFLGEEIRLRAAGAYGAWGRNAVELVRFETAVPELQALLGGEANRMHHAAFRAVDPAEASARMEALGFQMFLQTRDGGLSTFWHDARDELGHCIEISSDVDRVRRFQAAVARAAEGWDGTEPLRSAQELQQ
jgi:hypothetical protein